MSTFIKKKFTNIYLTNYWNGSESKSGPGSNLNQTYNLRKWLTELIQKFRIKSILDVPCGDYNWMSHSDLKGIYYEGWDIVDDIIQNNLKKHPFTKFKVENIVNTVPSGFDLILCRDLLSHYDRDDGLKILNNLRNSGAKYLLINTYANTSVNQSIKTGEWFPINLTLSPYNLPKYSDSIEDWPENEFNYSSKLMALWIL